MEGQGGLHQKPVKQASVIYELIKADEIGMVGVHVSQLYGDQQVDLPNTRTR